MFAAHIIIHCNEDFSGLRFYGEKMHASKSHTPANMVRRSNAQVIE